MMELKIDPEFESLLRRHNPDEAKEFERQMFEYGGAHDPIMYWNNSGDSIILDGHHRWRFIQQHPEMTYRAEEVRNIHTRQEAMMWIYYEQKGKRNLSPFESAELALKFEPALKEEAKIRQGQRNDLNIVQNSAPSSNKNKTRDEVARIAGVSHDTIDRTKKILAEGTEEQIDAVRSGERSINSVYNEIRANKEKEAAPTKEKEQLTDRQFQLQQSAMVDEIANRTSNIEAPSAYTPSLLISEIKTNGDIFIKSLERCLAEHRNILDDGNAREMLNATILKIISKIEDVRKRI